MSDMKYQAIVSTGIKIDERVEIPKELVPKDAQVEITAKVSAGYHSGKVSILHYSYYYYYRYSTNVSL
jgi:hypothetical protein